MSEHIVQPRIYIAIFLALMVGTAITVLAAFVDFPGPLNAVVALTIAVIKATLVVLYFMHVRYSGRLIWLVILAALLWLAIMFAITLATTGRGCGCRRSENSAADKRG
jgi:cytochrome c oxidase subunit 4